MTKEKFDWVAFIKQEEERHLKLQTNFIMNSPIMKWGILIATPGICGLTAAIFTIIAIFQYWWLGAFFSGFIALNLLATFHKNLMTTSPKYSNFIYSIYHRFKT